MIEDRAVSVPPDRPGQDWLRYLAAALITAISLAIVVVLWRRLEAIPDPGLILLFTVAAATYLAGGMAGMLSAAIVLFCSFVLFSHPNYPFRYSDLDWRQMMVIVVACPIIALMVGSLKEQVDRLKQATAGMEALREQVRRLDASREAQYLCEQRFRIVSGFLPDSAICVLDANGMVRSWSAGAERVFGYSETEIMGQNFSKLFTREDLVAKKAERLLEVARFSGQAAEEGWRLRKGGGRFRAVSVLHVLTSSAGAHSGYVFLVRELPSAESGSAQT